MTWLVPDEDQKWFLEFFGRTTALPWAQSNPAILRIAAWKKVKEDVKEKKDNGKDKPN